MCNSGVSLIPTVNGETHHFSVGGVYDGLFVMVDRETDTIWNHVTGEAMHGPLTGADLETSNLLQMSVGQALSMHEEMRVAISDRPYVSTRFSPDNANPAIPDSFIPTLGEEDARRPRMDIGLGIWANGRSRYYPMETLRANGNAFIDEFDGQRVLIYIQPESATPAALFVDAASVTWSQEEVRLDTGILVRAGLLVDERGQSLPVERPQQMFTRWYGFALTFPGCEVYGE